VPDFCKQQLRKGFMTFRCSKKASRDGYCGVHHPDAKKARREKQDAKWNATRAKWEWQEEERKAIAFVVQAAVEWERGESPEELLRQAVASLKRARIGLRSATFGVGASQP